jgi:sugar phosphate isomerase/epimerase
MDLLLFHSLWGFEGSLEAAIDLAQSRGFDGLELNLRHPVLLECPLADAVDHLRQANLALVLELVTGGDYVPDLACGVDDHLAELEKQLAACPILAPLKVTVITGSDSWSWHEQERFWLRAIALAEASGLAVSFETHRSRSLANPWAMADWLAAFPGLRLTADLSHWCVVAERLMTPELAPIQAMAAHVDHIHARIGYAQGPQVNHPFAPEHHQPLAAHLACWKLFAASQAKHQAQQQGDPNPRPLTMTPEFGPDGYLQTLPFTNQPVADLLEINTAMASWLRQELGSWSPD